MNKMNEHFNSVFNNVKISKEKTTYLNEKIITGYHKKKRNNRIILSFVIVLNIILISTGITYANEIKGIVTNMFMNVYTEQNSYGEELSKLRLMSNVVKEINYEASLSEPKCDTGIDSFENIPLTEECLSMYTYDELEKELGIKLLKNDLFKRDKFILTKLKRKDGKIASLMLEMGNTLVRDKEKNPNSSLVDYTIYIRTKYSENQDGELNHGNYTEETIPKYTMNNLNTLAYGIEYGKRRMIYFDYDNIIYSFSFSPGIESRDNPDEEIQSILNGFHY